MISTRNVIIAVVAVSVLSIAYTVYELAKPPDAGGFGKNSYGTRAHGHRAIYEVIEKLGETTRRSHFPPPAGLSLDDLLVMIMPQQQLVEREPEHLRRTGEWVSEGGNMLVALKSPEIYSFTERHGGNTWDNNLLEELGIPGVKTLDITPAKLESPEDEAAETARLEREKLLNVQLNEERPTAVTTVTLHGVFSALAPDIKTLRLPMEHLQVLDLTTSAPTETGRITVSSDDGVAYTLAAGFKRGSGAVTVLAEGSVFNNYTLTAEDNAVLTANLLGAGSRNIVFDEFFHGLHSRGNPLWLLTRPNYGWLFIMMLLMAGIWIWKLAIALGPPLPETKTNRRTLIEYLDAMAALFTRSRQNKFVLAELRDGVLWALRSELHLSPSQEQVETIAAALERHDPRRAKRFRAVNLEVDNALSQNAALDDHHFLHLSREISRCL